MPPEPQSERFLETARALGADKDEGALDRVFGKVVPPVVPNASQKDEGQEAADAKTGKSPS
jgi:hypothetical protein